MSMFVYVCTYVSVLCVYAYTHARGYICVCAYTCTGVYTCVCVSRWRVQRTSPFWFFVEVLMGMCSHCILYLSEWAVTQTPEGGLQT